MNIRILASVLFFSMILFACNNTKKTMGENEQFIKSEIVAQLKGKVSPKQVVLAYPMYKIKTEKEVNASTNTWLFSYDTSSITADEMLHLMKNSQFVSSAEFNKKI